MAVFLGVFALAPFLALVPGRDQLFATVGALYLVIGIHHAIGANTVGFKGNGSGFGGQYFYRDQQAPSQQQGVQRNHDSIVVMSQHAIYGLTPEGMGLRIIPTEAYR